MIELSNAMIDKKDILRGNKLFIDPKKDMPIVVGEAHVDYNIITVFQHDDCNVSLYHLCNNLDAGLRAALRIKNRMKYLKDGEKKSFPIFVVCGDAVIQHNEFRYVEKNYIDFSVRRFFNNHLPNTKQWIVEVCATVLQNFLGYVFLLLILITMIWALYLVWISPELV